MKWFVCLVALVPMAVLAETAGPAAQLQKYLDGMQTLQADFRQTSVGARARPERVSTGHVSLQKPGHFRWDYAQPEVRVIVSDGVNLWQYDAGLEQAIVKSIGESLAATPALLLTGKQDLTDGYTLSDAGVRAGVQWTRLAPKRDDTDFTSIELGFANGELRAMELADKLGDTTRIEFTGVRRNAVLDASVFKFEPPAGADVIGKPR